MRPLLLLSLILAAACLTGCPRGADSKDTTAAPARGATAALLPPKVEALAPAKVVTRQALPHAPAPAAAPDDIPESREVLLDEPSNAVLEHPQDRDRFTLWLPAHHPLLVEAHGYGEVTLELFDPCGAPIAQGSRSLTHLTETSGVYTIQASAVAGHGLHYTLVASR